jgi:uncharacterized membrane protein
MTDLAQPQQRLLLIDALRGVAIAMMVAFHFCFDLSYFGLANFNFYQDSFWLNARTLILSSFLFLVGVSLVLATRSGLVLERYLRRLGYLLAAALLVSAATWWMFAERFVFFGVLHFIALASVLGLVFVRAGWLNLVLGIALILVANRYQSPWFDEPGRRWIGLMTHKPPTEDYVPLLPWFGVVLLGIFAGPTLRPLARDWQPRSAAPPLDWLAFAGRHSLLIYLLHQPLLMGALALYSRLLAVSPAA